MLQGDGPLAATILGSLVDATAHGNVSACGVCEGEGRPAAPHTSGPLTSDLPAIDAIDRYDTGTWGHIRLIVWKATKASSRNKVYNLRMIFEFACESP
mgnify:CR=1 FL=1